MSLDASAKIPMGTLIPSFCLSDPKGKSYKSDSLFGPQGLLVIFMTNYCPYAKAAWPRLVRIAKHAKCLGISTVVINPQARLNDRYDSPKEMTAVIKINKIDFPYLLDEEQRVARDFQAKCIPDVFLYDHTKILVYHGRIDDSWKDEAKATSLNLKFAVDALAAGEPVERRQISSVGCSIKWRKS